MTAGAEAERRFPIGSLVRARGREWVVLPPAGDIPDLLLLRPLGGTDEDACGIYLPLEGHDVAQATFAPPDPRAAGDSTAALLLRDATRLNFRAGAGPFRSLGRIAVEPRAYQLVPLLMALRLSPVRLLIADDVGIGKTVEAALIARELLDRGEIRCLAVLCPPHLCDQWQAELAGKFHIDAEVVRPGTVARLERGLAINESLFDRYPALVVSIDYIKSDRRRDDFVRACPEFVIVDEAHGCAVASAAGGGGRSGQQQRHRLIAELAANRTRHLILTTATPHSGIEAAFRSLLGLLDPAFGALPEDVSPAEEAATRARLAGHLIQRRRGDIRTYVDERTTFPERITAEATYALGPAYRAFFDKVHAYATELVRSAEGLARRHQRIRWWAALALLRCVTSSPAAAAATLTTRVVGLGAGEGADLDAAALDIIGERAVLDLDTADAATEDDVVPGADTIEGDESNARERRRLRELAREADGLRGANDRKLIAAAGHLQGLLDAGSRPIVYCRYIATAEYLAEELRKRLKGVEVVAVTGRLPAEERAARVTDLLAHERRVLVATDCLSEGINLQEGFDAVLHYDLSWNPTRHEQREGRVDRYGQPSPEVRTILLYGEDNRVDGAIMRVLLRKAEAIRKSLGVSVPVPSDTGKVLEAVFEALFLTKADPRQLSLQFDTVERQLQQEVELGWERAAERERRSRSVFAQATIKADDVRRELQEAADALGDGRAVARFVSDACARLGTSLVPEGTYWRLVPATLPAPVRERAGFDGQGSVLLGFELPVPERVTYIARTHPLVEALGAWIVERALDGGAGGPAARCGAIRTLAVDTRTTILILRARMHLDIAREGAATSLLAEECFVAGFRGRAVERPAWLPAAEAEELLRAEPAANVHPGQREGWLREALGALPALRPALDALVEERAAVVLAAHGRVRAAARLRGVRYGVRPILPADILGVYVLMPIGAAVVAG
jgi:hypothetical protein